MWMLPSRGRPERLKQFFSSAQDMGMTTPGTVLVSFSDPLKFEYYTMRLPKNWAMKFYWADGIGETNRRFMSEPQNANLEWFGLISDDFIVETVLWDQKMVGSLNGKNFVSANDGWQSPNRMGASVFSGDLIRTVGYLYPPELHHYYMDDMWEMMGRDFNLWEVRMDVIVRHDHHQKPGLGHLADDTYKKTSRWMEEDGKIYEAWKAKDYPAIKEKLRKFLS